jgi:AcrR family transcriptional regulator
MPATAASPPTSPGRPRDPRRDEAIREAVLALLAEVGYERMSVDAIATAAGVSKPTIYRRWPGKHALVADAIRCHPHMRVAAPDTGSLRGDLLALLRRSAQLLAGPAGEVVRAVLSETLHDPGRVAELHRFASVVEQGMQEVVRRAISRAEIVETAVTPRRLEAGQALLRQHFLFNGPVVPDTVIVEIVDEVAIPLLSN